jgi:hypothetical protein
MVLTRTCRATDDDDDEEEEEKMDQNMMSVTSPVTMLEKELPVNCSCSSRL